MWLSPDLHSGVRERKPVPAAGMLVNVKGFPGPLEVGTQYDEGVVF